MKNIFSLLLLTLIAINSKSQVSEIEWQNTIGGDANDYLNSIKQTADKGYILGGSSNSGLSGDKASYGFGNSDYWIIKLDSLGIIEWQKTIGGEGIDELRCLIQTNDGGFIAAGSSGSGISGNKTEESISGSNDYWIVKLDSEGLIQWQNDIGGSGNDQLYTIAQTNDNGYMIGGYSNSGLSGDKTELSIDGTEDYWILKLDDLGIIQWQKTIGGNSIDRLRSLQETTDGGYILGGYSYSPISGDKTEVNFGSADYWILKIDSIGTIQWQNTIGGNQEDWAYCILQANDKSFIVGGMSNSGISGDKTGANRGSYDYWTLKLDSLGNIIWQSTIGGSLSDILLSLIQTSDNGYFLGGWSSSGISGDKTTINIGFDDYWVLKLDDLGNILWQKTVGGWSSDGLNSVEQTIDGGYILGGDSFSPISGDKTEDNIEYNDFWVVKLSSEECIQHVLYSDEDSDGYGNNYDSVLSCFSLAGYVLNNLDCNDTNADIHPFILEICNSIDDNCNFEVDEGLIFLTFYSDYDNDGFGNSLFDSISCVTEIIGFVSDSTDCDDSNALINSLAIEICNTIDDNCNNEIDEGLILTTFYLDSDSDSFGDKLIDSTTCFLELPSFVSDSTDCDDSNEYIYPGADEIMDNVDNNCDGKIDEIIDAVLNDHNLKYNIFPNPNSGTFSIIFSSVININLLLIQISDLSGNVIEFRKEIDQNKITFHLQNDKSGVFQITIANNLELYSKILYIMR